MKGEDLIKIKRNLAKKGIHLVLTTIDDVFIPTFPYVEGETEKQTKARNDRAMKEYLKELENLD